MFLNSGSLYLILDIIFNTGSAIKFTLYIIFLSKFSILESAEILVIGFNSNNNPRFWRLWPWIWYDHSNHLNVRFSNFAHWLYLTSSSFREQAERKTLFVRFWRAWCIFQGWLFTAKIELVLRFHSSFCWKFIRVIKFLNCRIVGKHYWIDFLFDFRV